MATKFTEEICNDLCEYREKGLSIKDCADLVGISRNTVTRWVQRGEKAKSGKYKEFYLRWNKASAKFTAYHHQKIADSKDWKASQYLLQVTDSDRYVVTEKKQVKADVQSEITVNLLERMKQKRQELNDLGNP